jgi:hypothetical protein
MGPSLGEPLAQIGPSEMANSLAVLRLAGKHFHVAALEGSGWIQRKWDHKLESTGRVTQATSIRYLFGSGCVARLFGDSHRHLDITQLLSCRQSGSAHGRKSPCRMTAQSFARESQTPKTSSLVPERASLHRSPPCRSDARSCEPILPHLMRRPNWWHDFWSIWLLPH